MSTEGASPGSTGTLLLGALFIALGILFPVFFHMAGLGPVFLPMFYPLLLAGFLLPWPVALAVGISTPVLSTLITQMPPLFILPVMVVEGAILTLFPALSRGRGWKGYFKTTLLTLLLDRIAVYALVWLLAPALHFPPRLTAAAAVLQGLPGCLLILLLVPPLAVRLKPLLIP